MSPARTAIEAEIAEVRSMLAGLPPGQAILAHGMEARLASLNEELAALPPATIRRAEVELTFRGKPVHRSEGVEAEFAGRAIEGYTKAVSLISANRRSSLRSKGPIPGRAHPRLFVCDRAIGSFGFVLRELDDNQQDESEPTFIDGEFRSTPTYQAVEQMAAILKASMASDDDLAEVVMDMDRRTLHAIRDFITCVADSDACAQHRIDGQEIVRFSDVGAMRGAAERLSDENIEEAEVIITGRLDGVLPGRRWFEILNEEDDTRITGRIDESFDDHLITDLKQAIDTRIKATVHVTKVGSEKKTRRHRLLDWEPTEAGQQKRLKLEEG